MKFCTAKRTQVPVGPAKFDLNRCNESSLWGEKPDFWPVSKNNTGSLPLCGILPVMKKHSEEMQTLRAGCSKAEPQILAPPLTPSRVGQNLISCRLSLPLPTNPVWWGSMHEILSYCGNRPTHTHTHPCTNTYTNRQDWLQYSVPQLSVQCKYDGQTDTGQQPVLHLHTASVHHVVKITTLSV